MSDQKKWWKKLSRPSGDDTGARSVTQMTPPRIGSGWSTKPRSRRPDLASSEWSFVAGTMTERSLAVRLHRFLRDNVPILKSAIWTWTRLAAAPHHFEIAGDVSSETREKALRVLDALDKRLYPERLVRFGGIDALLVQYFDTLFTDGAVAGELTILPSQRGLDRFEFIDTATLEFDSDKSGQRHLFQRDGTSGRIALDSDAIYYQPFDADAGHLQGRSLISAVGFVARVEQELVRDMQKGMHNIGYHRLHVKVKPPVQSPAESDSDYASRANAYFDATARALRDFDVDDNPITWDDVEIDHIGPSGQISASHNWYLNHRAMVEDVIAGCNLAPFMLGYSYGTTQSWARFKFEMIGRQILGIQRSASRFLEWIAGIELALAGIDAAVHHVFDNRLEFDRRERFEADRIESDIVIRQMEAGLLTTDQARRRLGIDIAAAAN